MKIMTQNASSLSEQKQTASFSRELMNQKITPSALMDGTQKTAESIVQSLQELGERCPWIWFPNYLEENNCDTETAFICLGA